MAEALIGFGGNLGDVGATIARAIDMFCDGETVRLLARSSHYRTAPWGITEQPAFLNCCIAVETALPPRDLLARALRIERDLGRDRSSAPRWGPRRIDIDLLAYDDVTIDEPGLTLPHPRLFDRPFVVVPLAEIRPDRVISGRRLQQAAEAADRSGIQRLDRM